MYQTGMPVPEGRFSLENASASTKGYMDAIQKAREEKWARLLNLYGVTTRKSKAIKSEATPFGLSLEGHHDAVYDPSSP